MKKNERFEEIDSETREKVDKLFDDGFEAADRLKKLCEIEAK